MDQLIRQLIDSICDMAGVKSAGLTHFLDGALGMLVLMAMVLGVIIGFISVSVLILIWLERKISARIQRRTGPMHAGAASHPWLEAMGARSMWLGGLLQTTADAIKLLCKEDLTPSTVDPVVFFVAPCLVFTASLMAYIVIPFSRKVIVTDLNVGILYLLAVSSMTVLGIMMAGWGSNNKYSLLGGLRSVAQMISYEIPMIFALLGPVVMAGTLSMQGIVLAQEHWHWFLWPNLIGFIVYVICGTAETNRPPFDLPEGESELVAGFVTEYSGMKFAMFFLAEFSNMFIVSAVAATMFLGGWSVPWDWNSLGLTSEALQNLAGALVFFIKTYFVIFVLMWIRWTFPRMRVDQLMHFGWKTLLPLSFVNLLIAAVYTAAFAPQRESEIVTSTLTTAPEVIGFYLIAIVLIGSAIQVVRLNNIFHAGLFLVLTFGCVAAMYALLSAHFIAAVQVLIYVGAIAVILEFAVMLTQKIVQPRDKSELPRLIGTGFVCALFAGLGVYAVQHHLWTPNNNYQYVNIEQIGMLFLGKNDFILPFELVAVLLLIALIGAVMVAWKEEPK